MRIHPISCGLGHAFLIEAPQGLYLVDCGSPGMQDRILQKMNALGRRDLKLIWITHAHYDHYGSASVLRELTGAAIGVHPADASNLSNGKTPLGTVHQFGFVFSLVLPLLTSMRPLPATTPDLLLEDGETLERFGLDASILHTPGHTPGHTCLLVPEGSAFAGDLIGRSLRPRLQYLAATNWNQLPGSLTRLQAAQPEWIYTGHSGIPIPGSVLQSMGQD